MRFRANVASRALQTLVLAFSFAPIAYAAPIYKVIQNFVCGVNSSCLPSGPMIFDQDENLYGSAEGGGVENFGTVFELTLNPGETWSQTILHSFDFANDGEYPRFGVILASAGNLYGTTSSAGGPRDLGTVFELLPDNGGWTIVLPFDGSSGGGVVTDRNGNIYGAIGPGNYKAGAVGELSPDANGWSYVALYSFCAQANCADGDTPASPLTFDAAGNLYGTTEYGGNKQLCTADTIGCGVAFQLSPNRSGTWAYHLMHAFAAFSGDGQTPSGPLVIDRNGSIYGTTLNGGPTGGGTVFKLTPSTLGRGWKETVLYTFPHCSTGCSPLHGLAIDQAGNLYGAAGGGDMLCLGGSYCGVLFELSPQKGNQWTYTVVHKFDGTDGWGPDTPTIGPDGNVYGVTLYGGQNNQGVAFEITP